MMEKENKEERIGILSLAILAICLIALPIDLLAQQGIVNNTEKDNAAIYYSKALNLLNYPESEDLKNRLQAVVKDGWQEDDKELEKVLTENESVFDEFLKGLLLKKCDFNFGKNYNYLIDKELPPIVKIRALSDLLLLKGRYYEKQKRFAKAINVCLSLLTFANHIAQDNTLVSKMIALAVETGAYAPLKEYLNSQKVDQKQRQKILGCIEDYEKGHFPARELVEIEKELFISSAKMIVDGVKQRAKEETEFNDVQKKAMEALGDKIMRQAEESADRYYGNFAKAMETNEETDWAYAMSELEAIRKSLKNPVTNLKDVSNLLFNTFTKNVEESNEIIARKVVKLMLLISIPNFKRAAENYYSALKELKELVLLAEVKTQEIITLPAPR